MRLRLAACPRRTLLLGAILCTLLAPLAGGAGRAWADFITNNGSGAAPWETFTTINLGAGLHANIQAANGNLLLNVDGLSLPGVNGLDQSIELRYNSLSHNITQSIGYGWLLGTAQDVGLEFGSGSVTFYDETGQAYTVGEPSSCVFTTPCWPALGLATR